MVDAGVGAIDKSEAVYRMLMGTLNSMNPLGTSTDYQSFATNMLPTAVDKGLEFATNRTWYQRPIAPEQFGFEDKLKDSELYWDETAEWAKDLATWLSQNTGGTTAVYPGAIEVSPATLEYAVQTLTGGAGRDVLGTIQLGKDISEGNTGENLTKYPFVRAFVGKVSSRSVQSEMYKLLEKGEDPREVIEALSNSLTNKFLHHPSNALNQATTDEREELVGLINRLYQLHRPQ